MKDLALLEEVVQVHEKLSVIAWETFLVPKDLPTLTPSDEEESEEEEPKEKQPEEEPTPASELCPSPFHVSFSDDTSTDWFAAIEAEITKDDKYEKSRIIRKINQRRPNRLDESIPMDYDYKNVRVHRKCKDREKKKKPSSMVGGESFLISNDGLDKDITEDSGSNDQDGENMTDMVDKMGKDRLHKGDK
ncbi:hypothetical protein QVD17_25040 [Tagetes erecta]|uniref:Uncharacterized protein n=1 Tax=Tagetes erecta TaxID=13708 RepID=A0AAD8KFR1_TARER|nr:hypothetical protein QVD17_25040 [Tagetes erecta]